MLNTASPLPLYRQLADSLESAIYAGQYPVGSRIPSEPDLARQHGIARPTVRHATDCLVQSGLVERRRGSGTFVRELGSEVDLFSLAGTLAAFEKGGVAYTSRLVDPLELRVIGSDGSPLCGKRAYGFSRVGRVAGRPVLFEEFTLDAAVFPRLERFQLAGRSLARLVKDHYHRVPTRARQRFMVRHLPRHRAKLLGVSPRKALLCVERELDFPDAPGAIFAVIVCRTDEFAFSQDLEV